MKNSKAELLLTLTKDIVECHDDGMVCVDFGDNWFWVEYDISFNIIRSTNGVGGRCDELEVDRFKLISIIDENDCNVLLTEVQLKEFSSKFENILLELKANQLN